MEVYKPVWGTFSVASLPVYYAISLKPFVPDNIIVSPGLFYAGAVSYNGLIGIRVYKGSYAIEQANAQGDGLITSASAIAKIPKGDIEWDFLGTEQAFLPWKREFQLLLEFYSATLTPTGNITGSFSIRASRG